MRIYLQGRIVQGSKVKDSGLMAQGSGLKTKNLFSNVFNLNIPGYDALRRNLSAYLPHTCIIHRSAVNRIQYNAFPQS